MSIEKIIERLQEVGKFDCDDKEDKMAIRAAIEKLKTHPAAQPSATEEPYGCGVPLAGDNQPNEPQGDGWIAVKDRLPEPLEEVLVFYPFASGGEPKVDMGFVCHTGDWVFGRIYGQPTHWRPLPEPPEEAQR